MKLFVIKQCAKLRKKKMIYQNFKVHKLYLHRYFAWKMLLTFPYKGFLLQNINNLYVDILPRLKYVGFFDYHHNNWLSDDISDLLLLLSWEMPFPFIFQQFITRLKCVCFLDGWIVSHLYGFYNIVNILENCYFCIKEQFQLSI